MPRFTPLEFLGQGATGQVWKALDTTTNSHVALKMPSGEVPPAELPRFQQSYQSEAQIMQSLSHPGILKLIGMGQDEGRPFIAYEYLQGQTLRSLFAAGKHFTAAQTGVLMAAILEGLEYLHGASVVHRDLNPNNLMILAEQQGGVRILDFGAAIRLGAGPGPLIGTPQYMAPEQLQGGAPDPRSDLFSAAVVCYELLTGRPPFIGHSYPELVQQISSGHYPAARTLKPELPESVETFLRTALAVDPGRRYQTAGAMKSVLIHALSGQDAAPQTPSMAAITDDYARPTMISGTPVRVESAVLIAVEGPFNGRQFPLSGGITTLGGPYADVDLSRDLGIAAQHCWIIHEQDRFLLHDADESGGTILNGQSIKRAPLLEGDLIGIGESVFRFQDPHQPIGANRPPGSVEYGRPIASGRQAVRESQTAAGVAASTRTARSGSDLAIWLILILILFMIGGGLTIGALAVSSSVKNEMSLRLTPLWGRLDPILSAGSPEEFFAMAEKLDIESDRAYLASAIPTYPTSLAWLPGIERSVNEAQDMKSLVTELYDLIDIAQDQTDHSVFAGETVTEIDATRTAINSLDFTLNPWPLNRQTALSKLQKLSTYGVASLDPEMANHPLLGILPDFTEGLTAFNAGEWGRSFTKLDEALVRTDQWYSSASDAEMQAALTEDLQPATDVARTLMAVCEIRQAQIRLMHQPTGDLTGGDLDTIRGWVRDADSLLRRVQVEDLRRILGAFDFPAAYDPRTLNDEIDEIKDKIDELKKAQSRPGSQGF